ncbi:MAG: zinc ribbon domain-containing protein [Candidatus Thermoplasmatota archaeon]|nr:zinc ribbon domain-containing protein [Candidatus Thermoplasmatota archaeon]
METPAQRMEKVLKDLFGKFLKTPFVIPVGIALSTAVYMLVVIYIYGFCLSGLITPLAMVGIFWFFGIKDVKKLLIIGVVACLVISAAMAIYLPYTWLNLEDPVVETEDGKIAEGTVTPMHGTSSTVYNFTVTVHANLSDISDVSLLIAGVGYYTDPEMNVTMTMAPYSDPNATAFTYYYETAVPNPISFFVFGVYIGGSWTSAGSYGPVTDEVGTIISSVIPAALISVFAGVYPVYALLLLMIWWTRRARRMRTEAFDRAMAEREKEREGLTKDEAKVPSLSKAMGLEKDEGFVCSECGADVPADAKVCPKCGEKFD